MNSRKILLIVAVSLPLIGCGAGEPAPGALGGRASVGKPAAPVNARVTRADGLYVGVPATLTLEVRPEIAVDGLAVLVEGDDGLSVTGFQPAVLPALAAGAAREVQVQLIPTSGGTRRLTVLLVLEAGGQRQARPVMLVLEVGGPDTVPAARNKPDRPLKRNVDGTLVDSIPAETTVVER